MPGLLLTLAQAQQLWGLDAITCSALLTALVDSGFLFSHAKRRVHAGRRPPPATTPLISH